MRKRYLSQDHKGHGGFPVLPICIAVGASVVGLLLGFLLLFKCIKRKKLCKKSVCWPVTELRQYRFSEVEKATDFFSEERLMGSGAFGKVYKGEFDEDKRTLAIKIAHSESFVIDVEFQNEIELLSRVGHKNLVGLVGYCMEASQRVLVYEYVSNGSLLEYILGRERRPLTWQQRLHIAIGIARGLAYLHQEVSPGIIHRDVKPSNILIDDEFEPKISDFGLVKKGPLDGTSYVITQVKGTPGYVDPAYCSTCHLTPSSDVYSFGVILLQLVSACPVLDRNRRQSHYHITDWAKPCIDNGRVEDILDQSLLLEACNMKVMLKMAQLGLRCTAWRPKDRPTMSQVASELEEAMSRATKPLRRSSDDGSEELESISIERVGLQRFFVESFEDLSLASVSLRCLDVSGDSFGTERDKLSGIGGEESSLE